MFKKEYDFTGYCLIIYDAPAQSDVKIIDSSILECVHWSCLEERFLESFWNTKSYLTLIISILSISRDARPCLIIVWSFKRYICVFARKSCSVRLSFRFPTEKGPFC